MAPTCTDPKEIAKFKLLLNEIQADIYEGDNTLNKVLEGTVLMICSQVG